VTKLPQLTGIEAIAALKKVGFVVSRQRGSHVFLKHPDGRRVVTLGTRDILKKGTLNNVLRNTRLSIEEFRDLL